MPAAPERLGLVDFGRAVCNTDEAFAREWLVTNGLGGYASGTIGGVRTRRYHAGLVVATRGPSERTLLLGDIPVTATYRHQQFPLGSSRWSSGTVDPQGHLSLQRFHIEDGIPIWRWAIRDALLERRIFMIHGENTVCHHWSLVQSASPVALKMAFLVDRRSQHALGRAESPMPALKQVDRGVSLTWAGTPAPNALFVQCAKSVSTPSHVWWKNFELRLDRERGYQGTDCLFEAATMEVVLAPGESTILTASTILKGPLDANASLRDQHSRAGALVASAGIEASRPALAQLVLAADQFVVVRDAAAGSTAGTSLIAGYPWFGDWGRDSMIALPGLLLSTRRFDEAKSLLTLWGSWVKDGLVPNRFPDSPTDEIEFNSADAPLLMIIAAGRTFEATQDREWVTALYGVLEGIVNAYLAGTRHGIGVDPADGLIRASADGLQLTWMDARINGTVVTPRRGKPVELSAFWVEALAQMELIGAAIGRPIAAWTKARDRARTSFGKFWNERKACCFDVIDGPAGNDGSIRPNQLFASALGDALLPIGQRRVICELAMASLWTPQGLRTLAPDDPAYRGQFGGSPETRDGAYHQGTVWPWLFLPLAKTHYGVYCNSRTISDFLFPFSNHLREAGLGSVSEVFSGDAPHEPGGCFAQAWSVAAVMETLAWISAREREHPTGPDAIMTHG